MPRAKANGIEIEYESFGDPSAAPLLLVMGLGAQMISWDEAFCALLADGGFRVTRFDNRDTGLSTKMEEAGEPDMPAVMAGKAEPAYALEVLADDAVELLDSLRIRAAHIVGASMGGFITQLMALNHPDRVLSLTSIMSGPGGHDAVPPTAEGAEVLWRIPPPEREAMVEHGLWVRRLLAGESNPFDEAAERRRVERAFDRTFYPVGAARQLAAVLAAPSRLERLKNITAPTLVVHGIDDILVPVENGRRTAAAIPGARLLEFEGMGHNLPERFWPVIVDAIAETARKATVLQHG